MISMDKKYRTTLRDEVRIYAIDGNEPRPVHGAFKSQSGWVSCCWQRDGVQMNYPGPYDLIEVKPRIKRTVWANLYIDGRITLGHPSKEDADKCADRGRLACVKVEIDCEEGEGL
jgi:hypothetical protein